MTTRDWALAYARLGWRVFPVLVGGKRPLYRGWQRDATTDPAQIARYWRAEPGSNIGIVCGEAFDAFDIEAAHLPSLRAWMETHGHGLPRTPLARTGRDGIHILVTPTGAGGGRDMVTRKSIERTVRGIASGLTVWAALVAVGIAPTAVAIVAAVSGSQVLFVAALTASLAVNGWLMVVVLRARRRIALVRRVLAEAPISGSVGTGLRATKWLPTPGDLGSLAFGVVDLERAWDGAVGKAKAEINSDVLRALSEVNLDAVPSVQVRGWSPDAKVRFTVSCTVEGTNTWLSAWRDKALPAWMGPVGLDPLWRSDDTWGELIRRSWVRERPFQGRVALIVEHPRGDPSEKAQWRIDYYRQDEAINYARRSYNVVDGELIGPEES